MRIPLPLPPRATPSPPPFPGGKSAINGAMVPPNHAAFFGNAQNPRVHGSQGAIRMPTLQPPMRCTLRGPLWPTGDITPATACYQHVEQGISERPKRRMRHAALALRRCRGKDILEQAPL
jgi:hypothetical protein